MKKHIVVIGGGMAGTAAAYRLTQLGYQVTIVEKNDRLGGRIHSITTNDAIFEVGAGFVTNIYTNIFAFLKATGLDTYLKMRKSYPALVRNGELQPLFSRSVLLGNSVLSARAKLQLLQKLLSLFPIWSKIDLLNMWKAYPFDTQSISQTFETKGAQEVLDYLIQPALDGYFYWSADRTSEAMLAILFKAAFTRHRTYILTCGLQRIPEAAAKESDVLLSHEVTQVQKFSESEYEVTIKNNKNMKKLRANGIVCATTATVVPKIIKKLSKEQSAFFYSVHYSATAIVAKTYNPKDTPQNYGIAYPRKESTTIGAVTIVSDIMKDKKKKITLVKFYASGAAGGKLSKEVDDTIDRTLSRAASLTDTIFDTSSNDVTFRYIQRWEEALPEFSHGHFHRLKAFMNGEVESEKDAIVFAGDYIGGSFIEGAFTSGIQAAERLDAKLKSARSAKL